jgi:signal peptidase I
MHSQSPNACYVPSVDASASPVPATPRSPRSAALLALLCHGLGHVYAGRWRAGLAIHAIALALGLLLLVTLGRGPRSALAVAVALAFWIAQGFLAARAARASDLPRGWISRPLGLVLFYVATVGVSLAARLPLEPFSPHSYSISSGSMVPTLRPGEWFLTERRSAVERGDVIIHAAPQGLPSRDPMVKRVVALGGDTVEVRDGRLVLNGVAAEREPVPGACTYDRRDGEGWHTEPCVSFVERVGDRAYETHCTPALPCGDIERQVVPPGHVFVLGDHRDHSADSRVYGPVPEASVLGRASWVYWSFGPTGIRWERLGSPVR